jgi:hypothetical protein
MNDYTPDTPRIVFAFGALALMALTLGALVVAPAALDAGYAPDPTLAVKSAAPIDVAIVPARIEVVGKREPNVAWALPQSEPCKPQG